MVEVVISSEVRTKSETEEKRKKRKEREEEEDDEIEETQRRSVKKRNGGESGSSRNGLMVRWEKLFPKMMALRVLLVEADDSTRQIISALLRKCNYKVASVSDGLKAWELLKGRPHNIDLILTEVDLPSISGYALLTLIMEHEICKNIPVIMMSSQDSTSTVYKCMLRGAADYLVKPIRRNELRNLWQHVWRRQSSIPGAKSPQDESVGQDKVEATSENNAASNHSRPDMACIQNNKEFIEKGSDAQSSSTKPDADAESVHLENMRDILQPLRGKLLPNDMRMQKHEASLDCGQKLVMHENEAEGSAVAASKDTNRVMVDEDAEPEIRRTNASITLGSCDNNHVPVRSSREAIDFMGMSASHHFSSDNAKSKFEFSPHLDLSLTRCHPSGFEIQNTEERFTLRQSNASAFTRYTSRPLQPVHSTLTNFSNQKELVADSERKFPSNANGCNSDTPGPSPSTGRSIISPANGQTRESEIVISHPQQRVFPIKVPVNGISFNNLCTSYGSIFSPTICNQSGASPIPSPNSGNRLEPNSIVNPFCQSSFNSNSENLYRQFGKTANDSTNRSQLKQDHKLDSLDDRGHISPTTDQSATSSLCNGASHPNTGYGSTSGSNSNVDQVYIVRVAADGRNDEGVLHNANAQRSIQRDAALSKFRLKRKDRCYEKKVRYESRKKLAEQRPRVKGQFVRQVQTAPAETDG